MRRHSSLRLTLALLLTTASIPAATAQDPSAESPAPFVASLPDTIAGVPGTWDLARDGSTRRCVLTLTATSGESGRRLSFPAGCRRALPILNGIAGWLFADGAIRLVDNDVRPVLVFARRADARSLTARTEAGEAYNLVPLQVAAMQPPALPGEVATPNLPAGMPRNSVPDATDPIANTAPVPRDAPASGIYALDRYRDQDVCRLDLMAGVAGRAPVRILDGCRDGGLSVFDPVAWRYADGRLTLTAKRGHSVNLVPAGEGRWRRDPDIGTTFVLRRVEASAP